jgi:hypothetical protein
MAMKTMPAMRGPGQDHPVALFDLRHPVANFCDDARRFMPQNDRQSAARAASRGTEITVTHGCHGDLNQDFALLGRGDQDCFDFQGLPRLLETRSFRLHQGNSDIGAVWRG